MADPPDARLREIAALAEAAARRGGSAELEELSEPIDDALDALREVGDALACDTTSTTLRGVS